MCKTIAVEMPNTSHLEFELRLVDQLKHIKRLPPENVEYYKILCDRKGSKVAKCLCRVHLSEINIEWTQKPKNSNSPYPYSATDWNCGICQNSRRHD